MKNMHRLTSWLVAIFAFTLPLSTAASNIILLLLVLLWLQQLVWQSFKNYRQKVGDNTIFSQTWQHHYFYPLYAVVAIFGIGMFYTTAPLADAFQSFKKVTKLLYIPILAFYLPTPQQRKIVVYAFLLAVLGTVILAILTQYEITTTWFDKSNVALLFKNTIDTSLVVAIAMFLLLHEFCKLKAWLPRLVIMTLFAGASLYLFFYTVGRSGQALALLLILLFLVQQFRFKGLFIAFIGLPVILLSLYFTSPVFKLRWAEGYENYANYNTAANHHQNTSVGQRLEFITNSLRLIKQRPIFGYGTGSFKTEYHALATKDNMHLTDNPHNEYLNIMVQTGLVGIIAFLVMLLWFFGISFHSNLECYYLQAILLVMGVGSLGNSWLMDFTAGHLFVLFVAVAMAAKKLPFETALELP